MIPNVKQAPLETILRVNEKIPEFYGETRQEFEGKLLGKESLLLVATNGKTAAGYLVGYAENKETFYIWMAGTIPSQRKKGVMKKLMDYAEKFATKNGFKQVKIKTRNERRAQLINLVNRNYMFESVESRPTIEENKITLTKKLF